MFNGFFGLRHHTIICCDHNNHNICDLCPSSTHRRKGFVTWGVDKGNATIWGFNMISTNMLGNAACFTCSHFGFTDIIKKRSFTMVNMPHNSHHRGAVNRLTVIFLLRHLIFKCIFIQQDGFMTHLFNNQLSSFLV